MKKNKHRCESSKWCSFIASALARNVQENNLPGINKLFLHTPELEKAEEEREKKSKITYDSICPAHPKALRRGSALLLAACRRPGSLCFCVSVFSRSLLHSPRLDPRVQPTTSRLQDPVRSADGGLCGAPPSLPTPSPLLRLLPLHAAAGEKTRCSGSEHRGRRRRSQGDAGPLCSQTD